MISFFVTTAQRYITVIHQERTASASPPCQKCGYPLNLKKLILSMICAKVQEITCPQALHDAQLSSCNSFDEALTLCCGFEGMVPSGIQNA